MHRLNAALANVLRIKRILIEATAHPHPVKRVLYDDILLLWCNLINILPRAHNVLGISAG